MVTAELTSLRTHTTVSVVALAGLTMLGVGLGATWPTLAGPGAPHAVLDGSLADALAILANNLRVVAAPFALALLGLARTRVGRRAGDLVTLAVAGVNAIPVGVALGRWRGRLLPYVPQLPLEWVALSVALTAWLQARGGQATPRGLARLAGITVVLLIAAAGVETWATPHRDSDSHQRDGARRSDTVSNLEPRDRSGGLTFVTDCAPATAGTLQGRALPSPHCARFRSAANPALTGLTSTHRPPQGGIT